MTGFKFRDLIPPGEGGRMAFERELQRRVDEWTRSMPVTGYRYRGGADLLLQHGRYWKGAPLRDEYAHLTGQESQCFVNSYQAAIQSDLQYVEGYYSLGNDFFMPHAWCVTPDGEIQDMTITQDAVGYLIGRTGMTIPTQDHWSYWGAVFHTDLVEDHVDNRSWDLPMLDRPKAEQKLDGTPIPTQPGHVWDFQVNHDQPILKLPYDPDRRAYP